MDGLTREEALARVWRALHAWRCAACGCGRRAHVVDVRPKCRARARAQQREIGQLQDWLVARYAN